jgi:hypothetical protein
MTLSYKSPSDAVQLSGARIHNKIQNNNNNTVPKYIIKHHTMQAYRGEDTALSSTNLEIVCIMYVSTHKNIKLFIYLLANSTA